ncbi:phage tail protein [Carnobacterium maltaromaticum]|uniref:phage tail protein n=1 Tax=Carnobacterium maltaromaticum TaxID=2751 RepID=UPI001073A137|nr:phage tail protein [Carnobacterium maltaromaticum]MDT1944327.1 phage tail family protein [Carnobacterium maltaromaticum]MDT1997951.1 phage tail family protein [Carnobacterium maltaromaticum]TFJ56870.1 hypothetical protein CKN96_10480 [Carnobacterium maltaromaticum]
MANNRFSYGIHYNGHHSSEFGLDVIDNKQISFPSKNKILVGIPHSSMIYDFSTVTGVQPYKERDFTIPFNIIDRSLWTKDSMYEMWTRVLAWLMGPTKKSELIDDVMSRYYYMAEVQDAPDFDELRYRGTLTVKFKCYPFRIATIRDFNGFWDPFSLEDGIDLDSDFIINGNTEIVFINAGITKIVPLVSASSEMNIIKNGITFTIPQGNSKSSDLFLDVGLNVMTVLGNGTLSFTFYSEVI